MKFRTVVNIEKPDAAIEHPDRIFLTGSCFAENIFSKLSRGKLNCILNPFGILYNPASILNMFNRIEAGIEFKKDELFQHHGLWHSFDHHSDYSAATPEIALSKINSSLKSASQFLSESDFVIVSLGTSVVFESIDSGKIVGNCHKLPADKFRSYRMSQESATEVLGKITEVVKKINPRTKIIFTVSPVRHWKNGAAGNQLSKAVLLLAVESSTAQAESVYYFPAYELLLDDLRDYRFYADDLLHPNSQAVEYIWERFSETWMSDKCRSAADELAKITDAVNHRPRFTETSETNNFASAMLRKIETAESKYQHVVFTAEREHFSKVLGGDFRTES